MASYFIEFDIMAGHSPGTGATLTPPVFTLMGWRSIGNSQGGRFINKTGKTIQAIYLKINGNANSFTVTPESGGKLFNTIWVKADAAGAVSEAYFMDGNVPDSFGSFWMRVPPNTSAEIQQCDEQQACPFFGQAFAQNPPAPTGAGWSNIRSVPATLNADWKNMLGATPSDFRSIDLYHESNDGRHVLFLSGGHILLHDKEQKSTFLYEPPKVGTAPRVNAITYDPEAKTFRLLENGSVVKTIGTDSKSFLKLGQAG